MDDHNAPTVLSISGEDKPPPQPPAVNGLSGCVEEANAAGQAVIGCQEGCSNGSSGLDREEEKSTATITISESHGYAQQVEPSPGRRTISLIPLIFLIFYQVSGGPFGIEDTVGAAGPLLALVGFLIFPLIWSIPEALITAELGTMFPENGGYVMWVSNAFTPFWGFEQGCMKWLSGVIDNALYPILLLDYLKSSFPALEEGYPRILAILALTIALTFLNYRGLTVVGWSAVCLGVFALLPFAIMGFVSMPKLKPSRWVKVDLHNVDWGLYLNTLFWNLNYWDSISTLAGERDLWTDGYFSEVAVVLGGLWLKWWVQAASAASNMGMFVGEMSSDSYQLLGMAERGMLPEVFSKRSCHGTPVVGIVFSAVGVLLLSCLSFQEIVAAENILYCIAMLLEFAAFVRLRLKYPDAARPYRVPMGTAGCVAMVVPPSVLALTVLAFSSLKVALVSLGAVGFGLVLYPVLRVVKRKGWMRFSVRAELPELGDGRREENGDPVRWE
ncbi:hypothetical protein HPP92_022046 [Vanilla planifolia]|uniref:Uncharacterized protein n=1 Tax=Vanilla planifolia TaxID=51239 RepID=A0A835PNY0_VANPL|nr:hypothetical protein HPP92_022046 [Vanilla planifolia]